MEGRQVVVDVDIQDVAQLPHPLLPVFVVPAQPHLLQEVTPQQVGLVLAQPGLEHGFHDAVEPLNVAMAAGLSAEPDEHPSEVAPHLLHLPLPPTVPDVGPFDVPVDPFEVVPLSAPSRVPPLAQLPPPKHSVAHELPQLDRRIDPFPLGDVGYHRLCALLGLLVAVEGLVQPEEVAERKVVEEGSQLGGREEGYFAPSWGGEEVGETRLPPGSGAERDELSWLCPAL